MCNGLFSQIEGYSDQIVKDVFDPNPPLKDREESVMPDPDTSEKPNVVEVSWVQVGKWRNRELSGEWIRNEWS